MRIAEKITLSAQVVYDDVYSPAEVFAALAQSLQEYNQTGKIPGKIQRESPLGPMLMPPEVAGISMVSMEFAMNLTDVVLTGGAMITWWIITIMLIVGFLTPLPYNYWRLKKYNVSCH